MRPNCIGKKDDPLNNALVQPPIEPNHHKNNTLVPLVEIPPNGSFRNRTNVSLASGAFVCDGSEEIGAAIVQIVPTSSW